MERHFTFIPEFGDMAKMTLYFTKNFRWHSHCVKRNIKQKRFLLVHNSSS